jgi:hypothetical protein
MAVRFDCVRHPLQQEQQKQKPPAQSHHSVLTFHEKVKIAASLFFRSTLLTFDGSVKSQLDLVQAAFSSPALSGKAI